MEKYYDMITKQEVNKEMLKPNMPYLIMEKNWRVRTVIFGNAGEIREIRYLSLQDEIIAREEILRQKVIQNGYKVDYIEHQGQFAIDGIDATFNVQNYQVGYSDEQGRKGSQIFDNGLNSIIQRTSEGLIITIQNQEIKGGALINLPQMESKKEPTEKAKTQNRTRPNDNPAKIHVSQFGYEKSYASWKELYEDQKNIPMSKEDAVRKKENQTREE